MSIIKKNEAVIAVFQLYREQVTAAFYKWRAKYGGMGLPMMTWLKKLEAKNNSLKKVYAEQWLKAEPLREVLEKKLYSHPVVKSLRQTRFMNNLFLLRWLVSYLVSVKSVIDISYN